MNESNNNNKPTTAFEAFASSSIINVPHGAIPTDVSSRDGSAVIAQSVRNKLRKEGLEALYLDLKRLYGDTLDVLEGPNGTILIVAENPDFTFTWELKSTIKGIGPSYDPFEVAKY